MPSAEVNPPGCGVAGPPPSPSTTNDKTIRKMPARDVFWLRKHGGDPAQLDLAGWHEVEEQHDGRVFARQ